MKVSPCDSFLLMSSKNLFINLMSLIRFKFTMQFKFFLFLILNETSVLTTSVLGEEILQWLLNILKLFLNYDQQL